MSDIKFEVTECESSFLDPRNGFETTTERFQVRIDPLTGRSGHVSHIGGVKAQPLFVEGYDLPEAKGICPFCLDLRDKATPRFTRDVLPEGRMTRGQATLVPNIHPYEMHSGVIIMTDDHVAPLEKLTDGITKDAFSVGVDFLKHLGALDPSLPYHVIVWNYMPPSGGGLVHPHQQCFATLYPGNQYLDELSASKRFAAAHGVSYWRKYIDEEERLGQRYIGSTGSAHWLSSFVSLGLLGEIVVIFPGVFSVADFSDGHIAELAGGLGRLFAYYRKTGIFSFNASLFFGPANQDYFPCHLRITPRTFINTRDCAPDMNSYQTLLGEPVTVISPEQLCTEVAPYFT